MHEPQAPQPPHPYGHSHEDLFGVVPVESPPDQDMRERSIRVRGEIEMIAGKLEDRFPDAVLRRDVATLIQHITDMAKDRRQSHQLWGLQQLGVPISEGEDRARLLQPLFSQVNMGELIRLLHDHAMQVQTGEVVLPKGYKSRTVSMELGHIDQFGVWGDAHGLDEAMRALTSDQSFRESGFEFEHLYTKGKDELPSRYAYTMHRFARHIEGEPPSDIHELIEVVRKRPVADLRRTGGGPRVEIVKRSTLVVVVSNMTREDRKKLLSANGEQFVQEVIESSLAPEQRENQSIVVPGNALGYARVPR